MDDAPHILSAIEYDDPAAAGQHLPLIYYEPRRRIPESWCASRVA